jgi:hypothetical protein
MTVTPEPIVEVAPGRWKPVDRCSARDRVAAALIFEQVAELVSEVLPMVDGVRAALGERVVLPDWASPQLVDVFDGGWERVMPSIVTVRRVRDDLKRWVAELSTAAGMVR